jgi:hypothetical protein
MMFNGDKLARAIKDWSEPLRVDNELSDINPWRGADEENKATLRPRFQDIGNS